MSLKRIFKKVGKLVKAVAPVASSFIPGVGGIIAGAIAQKEAQKIALRESVPLSPGGNGGAIQPLAAMPVPWTGGGFTTGGAMGLQPLPSTTRLPAGQGVALGGIVRMQGRDGRFRSYRWSARKGRYVQVRRTNPCNPDAMRRSLRRIEGFVRIEKRVDKILRRIAPKARVAAKVGFVKSRRR